MLQSLGSSERGRFHQTTQSLLMDSDIMDPTFSPRQAERNSFDRRNSLFSEIVIATPKNPPN